MIERTVMDRMVKYLFRGRIVTLMGARRVGKTTLVKELLRQFAGTKRTHYLNCDLLSVQQALNTPEAVKLKAFLGDYDLVVLDEAQNIAGIGRTLKIMADVYPEMQIIATGSSSFDLARETGEPLTGRVYPFVLYPLSLQEIAAGRGYNVVDPHIEFLLRFGSYPSIFGVSEEEARFQLQELVSHYLYRDILAYAGIRKSSVITDLVRLLALQLGSEVSYSELANATGLSRKTVINYIDLLEQSFIVFRLSAYGRNLRKEVTRSRKIYFYDVGVRNAVLQAFSPMALRQDVGALWENFCVVERLKLTQNNGYFVNRYFWRTYDQEEIDYLEERDGHLTGFEFKYNPRRRHRFPKSFQDAYPDSELHRVDRGNYWRYLLAVEEDPLL